jgi:hypothetical protein
LLVPTGFALRASNGYALLVEGIPARGKRPARLLLLAGARGKAAIYSAPATVTETSIESNLGELGEIAVSFHRSHGAATARCGKQKIRFESGRYEGKIDFHGEEGFTSVEATTAPGSIDNPLSGFCPESFLESSPSERASGAELFLRNPALGPELWVRKKAPGAPALITASTSEFTNGISIQRFAALRMSAGRFTYDRALRTATVHPPAPFAGSGRFDLGKKAGQRWSGDLTVDLPGRSGVPLTGPALRAYLVPSE